MGSIDNSSISNIKYQITGEGDLIGKGIIIKEGTSFSVVIRIKKNDFEKGVNAEDVYNQKILELIEAFKIGTKVSHLRLTSEKKIIRTFTGTKTEDPISWDEYRANLAKRVAKKKELIKNLSLDTTASKPELAEKLNAIASSDNPRTNVRMIRAVLRTLPHESYPQMNSVLNSLLKKELQFVVEDFWKTREQSPVLTEVSKNRNEVTIVSVDDIKASQSKRIDDTWAQAISKTQQRSNRSLRRTAYKYFWDGNAPWKQKKYELALSQIVNSFKTSPEGERIFKGGNTLEDLEVELRNATSPLAKKTHAVLLSLINPSADKRTGYRQFIISLRQALDSKEYLKSLKRSKQGEPLPEEAAILLDICLCRFKGVNMHAFLDKEIHDVMNKGTRQIRKTRKTEEPNSPVKEAPLHPLQFEAIDAAPYKHKAPKIAIWFGNLLGSLNINFDPHYKGNVPYINYLLKGSKKTMTCIRVGTPTMETNPFSAKINPEFRSFLFAYQLLGKKHVYVNLQKTFGNEKNRTSAIMTLSKEFPGTFVGLTLDQDSKFYKQLGEFAAIPDFPNFKSIFLTRMLDKKNCGFVIPKAYKDPDRRREMAELMDKLYEAAFKDSNFGVQQRKDFIELYYAFFELLVLKWEQPDSFNLSCKDAIDRGGKSNALLYEILLILTNQELKPARQRELETIAHSPAFLVKKQAIISKHERRDRLTSPIKLLQENPQICSNLRELGVLFDMESTSVNVPKE